MKTPTQEQIEQIWENIPSEYDDFCCWGASIELIKHIITEWEKIKDTDMKKELRLELGKEYITESGREVVIVYESIVRATPYLGVVKGEREKDGTVLPDSVIWYNPNGTHNEQCSGITIVKEKIRDK